MRKIFVILLLCFVTFSCGKDEKKDTDSQKNTNQKINENVSMKKTTTATGTQSFEPKKLTPEEQFELSEKERILNETKAFEAYQNEISKRNKIEFEITEKQRIEREKALFNEEQKKISETNKALFLKTKK